jgi:uncharacterized protein
MGDDFKAAAWQPVTRAERYPALDALRGIALLGVLLVNLESGFRVPLAEHILTFHTDPDPIDRAADVLVAGPMEFKAFALFSLLFGVGLAVFADRAAARGVAAGRFLARRLTVLLGLGLTHMVLVWNGDILTLYAVCGFLLLPLRRLPATGLVAAGLAAVAASYLIPWGFIIPDEETFRALAEEGKEVYARGGPAEVLAFHHRETRLLILPLLAASVPKVWGLMAVGAAGWKAGVFRDPGRHRGLLWAVALLGGAVGGTASARAAFCASTGRPTGVSPALLDAAGPVPLALAYGAALLLALRSPTVSRAAGPFAAAGQMALTNYLTQSAMLSLLFYGYGLGQSGRIGSAAGVGIGLAVYACQLALSVWWLRRYRFGPVEWLWRSLTYGRPQPMRGVGQGGYGAK